MEEAIGYGQERVWGFEGLQQTKGLAVDGYTAVIKARACLPPSSRLAPVASSLTNL